MGAITYSFETTELVSIIIANCIFLLVLSIYFINKKEWKEIDEIMTGHIPHQLDEAIGLHLDNQKSV